MYLPIRKNNEILKASSVQFMFSSNYENILTCTPINNSKDEFKLKCHYGPRKNSTGNVITSTGTITNAQSHLVDKKPLQQEQKDAVKSVNASKGFFDRIIKRPIKRLRQKILSKRIKKDNSATK